MWREYIWTFFLFQSDGENTLKRTNERRKKNVLCSFIDTIGTIGGPYLFTLYLHNNSSVSLIQFDLFMCMYAVAVDKWNLKITFPWKKKMNWEIQQKKTNQFAVNIHTVPLCCKFTHVKISIFKIFVIFIESREFKFQHEQSVYGVSIHRAYWIAWTEALNIIQMKSIFWMEISPSCEFRMLNRSMKIEKESYSVSMEREVKKSWTEENRSKWHQRFTIGIRIKNALAWNFPRIVFLLCFNHDRKTLKFSTEVGGAYFIFGNNIFNEWRKKLYNFQTVLNFNQRKVQWRKT